VTVHVMATWPLNCHFINSNGTRSILQKGSYINCMAAEIRICKVNHGNGHTEVDKGSSSEENGNGIYTICLSWLLLYIIYHRNTIKTTGARDD
jgi:hypothetical protein